MDDAGADVANSGPQHPGARLNSPPNSYTPAAGGLRCCERVLEIQRSMPSALRVRDLGTLLSAHASGGTAQKEGDWLEFFYSTAGRITALSGPLAPNLDGRSSCYSGFDKDYARRHPRALCNSIADANR